MLLHAVWEQAIQAMGHTIRLAGWYFETTICHGCEERNRQELLNRQRENKIVDLLRSSGLEPIHRIMTLANLEVPAGLMEILESAADGKENLYLWGPAGRGKSHAAVGVMKCFLAEQAKPVRFVDLKDFFGKLRRASGDFRDEDILDDLTNAAMLVLDDMGAQRVNDFSLEALSRIIDRWYRAMKKGLICTSNMDLASLGKALHDDRIPSRLAGMCQVIEMTGEDRRLKR